MSKKIIFVCDAFVDEVQNGGAVQSLEAIIRTCPYEYERIKSSNLTKSFIDVNDGSLWIISNMTTLERELTLYVAETVRNYVIIESDWKFCGHRNPTLHYRGYKRLCDCVEMSRLGKVMYKLICNSDIMFFKSNRHREMYLSFLPELYRKPMFVIGATFTKDDLDRLFDLKTSGLERDDTYVILEHSFKGGQPSIDYCIENNLQYEVLPTVSREELWLKLRTSKGLVYLASYEDTCPRVVIDAKFLDCDIILNTYAQLVDELWFNTNNFLEFYAYLASRTKYFWIIMNDYINEKQLKVTTR